MTAYHIMVKKGSEIEAYDVESVEKFHALAYKLWKENFHHKATRSFVSRFALDHNLAYVIDDAVHRGDPGDGHWQDPENRVSVEPKVQ
jgi:hypothetical protein